MHHLILEAVALPHALGNRLINRANKYVSEALLRGDATRAASTVEQRNNLYLLADQVLAFGVPGDFAILGCDETRSTRVMASVMEHHRAERTLHLYDDFQRGGSGQRSRSRLENALRCTGLHLPAIHEGALKVTLAEELPGRIAFAHMDCGGGDRPELHCHRLMNWLAAVYPRMGSGAIGVLMDYHDPDRTVVGSDRSPGVKMACDHFFKSKPECMQLLYGGTHSHAFFRKVW